MSAFSNRTALKSRAAYAIFALAPWLFAACLASEGEVQSGLSVLVRSPGNPNREQAIPASAAAVGLKSLDVAVDIDGMTARTTVTTVFQNDGANPVKAMFSMPLPQGAALDRFAMTLTKESEIIEGTLEASYDARSAFRRIVDDPVTQNAGRLAQASAGGADASGTLLSGGSSVSGGAGASAPSGTASSRDGVSLNGALGGIASATGSRAANDRSSGVGTSTVTGSGTLNPASISAASELGSQSLDVSSIFVPTIDPGILELSGRNACRATVFPIEPSRTKTVVVSYTQSLAQPFTSGDAGRLRYSFPLSAFESAATETTHVRLIARTSGMPMQMELDRPLKPKLARGQDDGVTASVELVGKDRLRGEWSVTVQPSVAGQAWQTGCAVQAHRPDSARPGIFAATVIPLCEAAPQQPFNVLFIVDASSSRTPAERAMAFEFVAGTLAKLPENSQFGVMALDRSQIALPGGWQAPTEANARTAADFLRQIVPVGNGDLVVGFRAVEEKFSRAPGRDVKIVYVGDMRGSTQECKLIQRAAAGALSALNAELFAVRPCSAGNGTECGADKLLNLSGAPVAALVPGMDAALEGGKFATMLALPVVRNATLTVRAAGGELAVLTQAVLGGLPVGRATTVMGTYASGGEATVTLNGQLCGRPYSQSWKVGFPEAEQANGAVAKLWARAVSDAAQSETNRFVSTQSALKHGAGAAGTAFLVTENHKAAGSYAAAPARGSEPTRSNWKIAQPAP